MTISKIVNVSIIKFLTNRFFHKIHVDQTNCSDNEKNSTVNANHDESKNVDCTYKSQKEQVLGRKLTQKTESGKYCYQAKCRGGKLGDVKIVLDANVKKRLATCKHEFYHFKNYWNLE